LVANPVTPPSSPRHPVSCIAHVRHWLAVILVRVLLSPRTIKQAHGYGPHGSALCDFRRLTLSWWHSVRISASSETLDRNSPMTAHRIKASIVRSWIYASRKRAQGGRSDAFDPSRNPTAPGAPRPLRSLAPAASANNPGSKTHMDKKPISHELACLIRTGSLSRVCMARSGSPVGRRPTANTARGRMAIRPARAGQCIFLLVH